MNPHTVGQVQVGSKHIEIRAVTGEISVGGSKPSITVRGETSTIENKVSEVGFNFGDRATLFWCARGNEESDWAAGYNHTTGKFGVSNFGINELILLPAHNFLGVVAVFSGVFSLATGPGALLVLPFSIGFFVYVKKRYKKVRHAIEAALEGIKRRESAQPAPGAAKEADLDFSLKTT